MEPKTKTKCLDCQTDIEIPQSLEIGEIVECKNCGAEMEILSLDPLKMEVLEEEK
jgi:alpha-aminoadipate carrier protein LysW